MIILQLILNGLSLGITYGIIAVGLGLIITTTGVFHIAHSAIFLTGGYCFFIFVRLLELPLFISVGIALAGAAIIGLAVDQSIYLPIFRRGGGMFTVFIASMGISLIFEAFFLILWRGVPSCARVQTLTFFSLGPINIRWLDVIFVIIGSIVYFCLYLWLHKTKMGLGIRGLADNASLASVFISATKTRNVVFAVGSVLGGIGGVLTTYDTGITPVQGFDALFVGIVALIVGGMGNVVLGTFVGGMILGVVKVFSGYLFPQWFYFFVFSTMVVSVIIRPEGLVGRLKN